MFGWTGHAYERSCPFLLILTRTPVEGCTETPAAGFCLVSVCRERPGTEVWLCRCEDWKAAATSASPFFFSLEKVAYELC